MKSGTRLTSQPLMPTSIPSFQGPSSTGTAFHLSLLLPSPYTASRPVSVRVATSGIACTEDRPLRPWWSLRSAISERTLLLYIQIQIQIRYPTVPYRTVPYRIASYRIVSYHIMSCHAMACLILSYLIVSYRILSYLISYHTTSCHIIPHAISKHISYHWLCGKPWHLQYIVLEIRQPTTGRVIPYILHMPGCHFTRSASHIAGSVVNPIVSYDISYHTIYHII